jgi:hypothetical protein
MKARRNILLIAAAAFAALLAGSCVKTLGPEDDGWAPLGGDRPVMFQSNITEPATKACLPSGTSFGVFAYYTKTTNWNSARGSTVPNFMYNEDVTFDGTTYTYDPIKYWPNTPNEKVSFWAYYPYSADVVLFKANSSPTAFNNNTKNLPDIQFTVTDGQTDFMISNVAANKTKPSINTPVELTFNHALSRISFYVKKVDAAVPEKYTVKLKSIRLDGIYLTATHKNTASGSSTVGWANWTGARGSIPTFVPASASGYLTLSTSYPADGSPQAVSMVLPQDLSYEYAMLHVEYTIDFEGLLHTRTMISNIPLSSVFEDASALWQKGKEYRVNISITPDDPIEFSVTWSNWGTVHNINC